MAQSNSNNPAAALARAIERRKHKDGELSRLRPELERCMDAARVKQLRADISALERDLIELDDLIEMSSALVEDRTAKFAAKRTAAIRQTPTVLAEVEQLLAQADAAMAEIAGCLDQAIEKLAALSPVCNMSDARRLLNKSAVSDAAVAAGMHRWLPIAAVEGISKPSLKSAFTMSIQPTVRNEAQRLANSLKTPEAA
jgi:hypothetical protein